MRKERQHYTAEEKVAILRRHLLEGKEDWPLAYKERTARKSYERKKTEDFSSASSAA